MKNIKIDVGHPEIVTVQQHLLMEQRKRSPEATGAFSWLLSGITLATKMTESKVRRAGLLDIQAPWATSMSKEKCNRNWMFTPTMRSSTASVYAKTWPDV